MTAAEPCFQALQLDETVWGERKRGKSPLCLLLVLYNETPNDSKLKASRKSSEQSHTRFPQFLAPLWDCTRSHHNSSPADSGGGRGWQVISCDMGDTESSLTCQRQRKKGAFIQ